MADLLDRIDDVIAGHVDEVWRRAAWERPGYAVYPPPGARRHRSHTTSSLGGLPPAGTVTPRRVEVHPPLPAKHAARWVMVAAWMGDVPPGVEVIPAAGWWAWRCGACHRPHAGGPYRWRWVARAAAALHRWRTRRGVAR